MLARILSPAPNKHSNLAPKSPASLLVLNNPGINLLIPLSELSVPSSFGFELQIVSTQ